MQTHSNHNGDESGTVRETDGRVADSRLDYGDEDDDYYREEEDGDEID